MRVVASCSFDISAMVSDLFSSGCGCDGSEFIIDSIRTSVGCCVIGTYSSNVAVSSGVIAFGGVVVTSGFAFAGGCKIGPFLIQFNISVTDEMCSAPVDN